MLSKVHDKLMQIDCGIGGATNVNYIAWGVGACSDMGAIDLGDPQTFYFIPLSFNY
jgi:hypothetical protein